MYSSVVPDQYEWSNLAPSLLVGFLALLGVVVGARISEKGQMKQRQNARNEKLLDLYVAWQSALDNLTKTDQELGLLRRMLVDPTTHPSMREELSVDVKSVSREKIPTCHKAEIDAFARICFYDCNSAEANIANEIRQIQPGKESLLLERLKPEDTWPHAANLGKVEAMLSKFNELETEQARRIGLLAQKCAKRFSVV